MQTPAPSPAQRTINLLVIHCSATRSGGVLQRGLAGQKAYQNASALIDGWHAERGFARAAAAVKSFNPALPHIGYHWMIDLDGSVHTGRHPHEPGAHAKGHNAHSLGVCLVGGAEPVGRYTPAQWKALKTLVLSQTYAWRINLNAPLRNGDLLLDGVCGHRDLSPDTNGNGVAESREWLKTCPGFSVADWLRNRLEPLAQHVFTAAAAPATGVSP